MVDNASGASSMHVPSAGQAVASPTEGEKNTKDVGTNLKDELIDLLGKDKGPITLKIYRKDGSDEVILNLKVSDLHSAEWREVLQACPDKSKKGWKTIYDLVLRRLGSIFTSVYAAVQKLKKDSWLELQFSLADNSKLKVIYLFYKDFQDIPDDEEDTRSGQEYLNDLEEEYQARDLLAKSKRFFKKDTQRFRSAKATDQTECHKCGKKDEEEVSSDDNEMVEVKVLMALAKDNEAVSKEGAKNGEWVKISMIKENVNYQSSRRLYNLSFLEYLKLYFFEYEHVAVNLTRHELDTATIGKPISLGRIQKNLLDRVSQLH
ncbi:hypothetical protein Tco_0712673 [Tanacetum coccineum]